jgi:Ser/Thr protein kinase RdoA (MazF antagonist)
MNKGFQIDTEERRLTTLAQAKQAALRVIQQYDLDWERITFNQLSDTITFKIETSTHERFLLRIHSETMNKEEIHSEIYWLQFLSKVGDLNVPEGMASREGSYVLEIEKGEGFGGYATLMRWVEGVHVSGHFTENHINHMFNMGILMARLHQATESFVPPTDFVRPTWGEQSFERDMICLEQYYGCFLSEDAFKLYQLAAEKILDYLTKLQKSHHNYGLIHADLHVGNIVFRNEEPSPIDFARCGFGFYLYDIAQLIIGLYPMQRQFFIQGYESIRKLDNDYVQALECFAVMACIENYSNHAPDPRETAGLIEQQPYVQALIRNYLNGVPFLFNPIELG